MARRVEPMARAAAAFAMGLMAKPGFEPLLEDLLKDSDPHVRSQALRALIRMHRQDRPAPGNGAVNLPVNS
jgi:HEAT repeat protein